MLLHFEPDRQEFESFLDLQLRLVGLDVGSVTGHLDAVYGRLEMSFDKIRSRYFKDNGKPVLRLANNVHATILIYELSRVVFESGNKPIADRLYALLRMVSAVDIYYRVSLPLRWSCDHPLGSVIGRGLFADEATLFFAQNCNIGNNFGVYPRIAGNLHMFPNSSLIGNTSISGNVVLANGACAIDAGTLKDCIVFGRGSDFAVQPLAAEKFAEISAFSAC